MQGFASKFVRRHGAFPLLALLVLPGLLPASACTTGPVPDTMIIIFASPSSVVLRGGQELPARPGLVLHKSDVLQTKNGSVDLQSRKGAIVRLGRLTTGRIVDLQGAVTGGTRLEIISGSALARVRQTPPRDFNFALLAPTASAGMGATTLRMEVANGRRPRVKVLAGQAAFRPRVPSSEPAGEDETLARLNRALAAAGVELEAGQSASLKPQLDNKLLDLEANLAGPEGTRALVGPVQTALQEKADPVRTEHPGVNSRDKIDTLLLVALRDDLVFKATRAQDTNRLMRAIERAYDKGLDRSIEQAREHLSSLAIKNRADLARHYRTIKDFNLPGGERVTGAIAAKAGNMVLIHSVDAILKKNQNDLTSMELSKR